MLIEYFMDRFAEAYDRDVRGLTTEALTMLLEHAWPSNIRELSNVVERAMILAEDGRALETVHVELMKDLPRGAAPALAPQDKAPLHIDEGSAAARGRPSPSILQLFGSLISDRGMTMAALQQSDGNVSRAAALLGVSRGQVHYKRKRLPASGAGSQ